MKGLVVKLLFTLKGLVVILFYTLKGLAVELIHIERIEVKLLFTLKGLVVKYFVAFYIGFMFISAICKHLIKIFQLIFVWWGYICFTILL